MEDIHDVLSMCSIVVSWLYSSGARTEIEDMGRRDNQYVANMVSRSLTC